ncbi:hypothetical protein TNCT_425851 [Trichonephila clavata]|uniref:Uncharacterized protein n=1 Tax=Trichonephila clavata TaxID=2740835 RepID=A0A8X6KTK3_TRICU|nr:hypothetical protein TNCT_425851 [Trichonephila clavata]
MRRIRIVLVFLFVLKGTKILYGSSQFIQKIPELAGDPLVASELLTDSPSVAIFSSTLQEEVRSSEFLSELFDFSHVSSEEFSRKMYRYMFSTYKKYKVLRDVPYIQSCIDSISSYHKTITIPFLVKVFANSVSKVAFVEGILNEENAESMALIFADIIREKGERFFRTGDPEWQYKAMQQAWQEFSMRFQLISEKCIVLATLVFGDAWKEHDSSSAGFS